MFSGRLQEQYTDSAQQSETAQLGMWVFIATEIMFFGALIFSYTVCRIAYPEQFRLAGRESFILLGSINQAILITSSLTMVLAVRAAKADQQRLVDAAEQDEGIVAREPELLRVGGPGDHVREDQRAEEHDLGRDEHPHAELCGLRLLRDVGVLLLQPPAKHLLLHSVAHPA